MGHSVNTSYAVIVLGDHDTVQLGELAERAAAQGAVITETYSFDVGEAVAADVLTDVEAVVAALSRAIASRTDLWVPFPMGDMGREEHLRRVSLVLQRHGLNLQMGRELEPCSLDGGYNPADFALRHEVRMVDELDHAAIAVSGAQILCAEVERELAEAATSPPLSEPGATAGAPADAAAAERPHQPVSGEKCYSTGEVARFLGQSAQWLNWAMRSGVFTRPDGTPIEPVRVGKNQRRRFTLPVLGEMVRACYRRGILGEDQLLNLLAVLSRAESE